MLSLIFPQYVYDFHPGSAHSGGKARHALRASSLIVEGGWGGTWLESRQAGALLIIMSSLQVSQRTVGGSGGGVDNMREQTKKNWCIFKRLCEILCSSLL